MTRLGEAVRHNAEHARQAARAGKQGRGFVVLASAVRSLAQRSAQAAREIRPLVTDSVKQVRLAVTSLDPSTQQNAALVEQSAAAAESLNQRAQALVGTVAAFRVPVMA